MDLATSVGRNDPSPTFADDFDPAAIVDRAIETGDWTPLDPFVDRFLHLAGRGGRLEHLRFPTEACDASAAWLGWCERELAYALGRIGDPGARRALRMAAYLVRRLGATSPIVAELRKLQLDEGIDRSEALIELVEATGFDDAALELERHTMDVVSRGFAILDEAERAAVIVQMASGGLHRLWVETLRPRLIDRGLEASADPEIDDTTRSRWRSVALAAWSARDRVPLMVPAAVTPRSYEPDELAALIHGYEREGGFGSAALLRETLASLQRAQR